MSIDVINEFVKVMNEKPDNAPSVFYHYTTPEGLVGIINSQELWLTDCKFLNDPSEKQHGLEISEVASLSVWNDLMTDVLASIEKKITPDKTNLQFLNKAIKKHKDFVATINSTPAYLMSFCAKGDLLSQWKGYSNYGKGFSIGFRKSFLGSISNFHFGPVIYYRDDKVKIMERVTNYFIDRYNDEIKKMGDKLLPEFFNLIGFISIFFKKNFFEEEKEWRLISIHGLDYKPDCRVTNKGITPFVKIKTGSLEERINEIIVGPMFDSNNIYSVSQMIPNVKINPSNGKLQ